MVLMDFNGPNPDPNLPQRELTREEKIEEAVILGGFFVFVLILCGVVALLPKNWFGP